MRIVVTSDTHGNYDKKFMQELPDGDLFIHCGDWSTWGVESETGRFIEWLKVFGYKYKYKVVIPGNHERQCDKKWGGNYEKINQMFKEVNTAYLVNEGIEIEGINIWGSPYTPRYFNWAFQMDSEEERENNWKQIPEGTDILITHGPPMYILDRDGPWDTHLGCGVLKKYIDIIKPKYHFFGHLHRQYGMVKHYGNTVFANVSMCDSGNTATKPMVIIDYEVDQIKDKVN